MRRTARQLERCTKPLPGDCAHDGHRVDTAADGADALRLAMAVDYDLVISDRRAAVGSEPFVTARERVRPTWKGRMILAATDRRSVATDTLPSQRLLQKPFNLRDLRMVAAEVWGAEER